MLNAPQIQSCIIKKTSWYLGLGIQSWDGADSLKGSAKSKILLKAATDVMVNHIINYYKNIDVFI